MSGGDAGEPRADRLFDAALADPHEMVWLLGPDGTVRRVGDAACSLVDAGAEAVTGEPFVGRPWWDEAAVGEHLDRALDGEFVRFRAPVAGTEVDVVLRPVRDGGDVAAVVAVGRTAAPSAERRAKLADLHDVATRLEDADDEAAVHELAADAAVDVLSLPRAFVGVLDGGRVVPRAWSDGLDRESAAEMGLDGWLVRRALGEGRSVLVDGPASVPDDVDTAGDSSAWLAVPLDDATLLVAADARPGAFDAVDRELADVLAAHAGAALRRLRHRRRLRRQNERLEEFAEVVAHDLRNPLGAMRANLQVAREIDDPEVLDAVERSVDRMDELLSDLLELASVGADATEPERVELAAAAEAAWETAAPTEAALSLDADVVLEADPSRLRQLLENLFDNAAEHGSTSPRRAEDAAEHGSTSSRPEAGDAVEHGAPDVRVTVGAIDGTGFYVADDGPGVPEAERESVFEHGFTTADGGTGFGLAIVRRIAAAHGWTASVAESASGGARFEFTGVDVAERRD